MSKATNTTSFKTLARQEGHATAEGVVLHGYSKKQRGRGLSMPFNGERNPQKALVLALKESALAFVGQKLREEFDFDYQAQVHGYGVPCKICKGDDFLCDFCIRTVCG